MTSDTTSRPRRRTQAERREATRAALLDATIESLVAYGYAGTTTARVADLAGVSRGAQVHYFASKAELVAAAVEHLAHRRIGELRDGMLALPGGAPRIELVLDVLWEAHQGQVFDATLELWVASRTDPELHRLLAGLERRVGEAAWSVCTEALSDEASRPGFRQDLDFAMSAARGLAVLRISRGENSRAMQRRWRETRERLLRLLG